MCEMPGNVSSYGFSGTISSYLVQSGKVQKVPKALDEAVLKFKRRSFAWKDDPHPFIIDPIPTSEESIFRSPVSGALRTIVTDHVVQGRIVFPGAGYLEMGHAAGAAVYGSSSVTLQGVFFLYAMVVEDVADSIAIETSVAGTSLSIRCVDTLEEEEPRMLVRGDVMSGGSFAPMPTSKAKTPSDVDALYAAFHSVGLQYGPAFRPLRKMWAADDHSEAKAKLSSRIKLQGTYVHPADLDGALQLTVLLNSGDEGAKLPFAVDEAIMQRGKGKLLAFCSKESAEAARVVLTKANGSALSQLSGFVGRKVGAPAAAAAPENVYATEWRQTDRSASAPTSQTVVVGTSTRLITKSMQAIAAGSGATVVLMLTTALQQDERELSMLYTLYDALVAVQKILSSPLTLALLTAHTQRSSASDIVRPAHAGLLGISRTARAEEGLPVVSIDGERIHESSASMLIDLVSISEPEVVVRAEGPLVSRLARLPAAAGPATPHDGASTQIVSGGTGGLGLLTARWLAQSGLAQALVLVSRGGKLATDMASEVEQLQASGATWLGARGDVSEVTDGRHIIAQVRAGELPKLRGLVHAAGVLADGMIGKQNARTLAKSFGAKVVGAESLLGLLKASDLHTCVLFSSVTALLGGGGQANYSAANCVLDSIASGQRTYARSAVSVQWGPWAEVGMAARGAADARTKATEASGLIRFKLALGLGALATALLPGRHAIVAALVVKWDRVFANLPQAPAFLSAFKPQAANRRLPSRGRPLARLAMLSASMPFCKWQ